MSRLYELTGAYARVLSIMEESDAPEEWDLALEDLRDGIEAKAENIARLVRVLESDADAFEAEAKRLTSRAKARTSQVARLKDYLKMNLVFVGLEKVKGILFTVSLQDSPPACQIVELAAIPAEYRVVIPETWRPDARAIIDAWKESQVQIPGTEVIQSKHIRIR